MIDGVLLLAFIENLRLIHPDADEFADDISLYVEALVDANGQIRNANQAGAQVFAHENIVKAIALHDQALTRRGKSDWETGRILGITEDSVVSHLTNARERYEVPKRTMLLVRALFDGTLSFSDILP